MRILGLLLAACALAASSSLPAAAQRGPGYGSVTAESRYGHGSISGPVRRGPQGRLEVRLPGGTWLECGMSCGETLRRQTVDFWDGGPGARGGPDGPGYLRFRF
jgi:hypothetical protein